VPTAHRLAVTSPSTTITAPMADSSSQSAWLAATNPVRSGRPRSPAARTEPATAMPRTWPIWRLVDAMPEATPACETGMPDTAV
jgi:hypothetical protein